MLGFLKRERPGAECPQIPSVFAWTIDRCLRTPEGTAAAFIVAGLLLLTGLAGCLELTVERYFRFEYLPLALFHTGLAAALMFWAQQDLVRVPGRWRPIPHAAVWSTLLAVMTVFYPDTPKVLVVVPGIVCALTCSTRTSLGLAAAITVLLVAGDLALAPAPRWSDLQADLVLGGVLLMITGVIGSISEK
ncbi:MAG: hypothetical protein H5T97_13465, partial [Firmicutes bacterium]|nr:hypothetical protein [Bacillota bacterium]